MASQVERIKNLLGSGLRPEVVATAVGCDASYISQLMSDENFREQVVELKTKALLADKLRDQEWDDIEAALLTKFKTVLPLMMQPGMIMKALEVANRAKRRGVSAQESTIVNNTVVNLNFPQERVVQFQKNTKNEIIEVEDRTIATLPSKTAADLATQLLGNLQTLREAQNAQT